MTKYNTTIAMKLIYAFRLFFLPLLASCRGKQVYTVCLEGNQSNKTQQEIEAIHHAYPLLVKDTLKEAKTSLIYSNKHDINDFPASLTPDEAFNLSKLEEVGSVFQSDTIEYSLQTTRSWEFLGLKRLGDDEVHSWNQLSDENDLLQKAEYGKDIIVGVLDTGIWPESESFNDNGMEAINGEIWKGRCESGVDFNSSHCNNKIIGAKYYLKKFERDYGKLNTTEDAASPRDYDGHGTHMASIIAGRTIKGVAAIGRYAAGTASGGAPMARLAIYKTCWAKPKQQRNLEYICHRKDILAGIKDAIKDGVHVLSISLATSSSNPLYQNDGIAVGSLYATIKDIVVVCAAGNSGPNSRTVSNVAPWVLTVGASTVDRMFLATLILGNDEKIIGQTITPYKLEEMHPLVYARDVENPGIEANNGQCHDGSLSREKVKGKIVFCTNMELGDEREKALEVIRAGGIGIILGNPRELGEELPLDAHLLPAISLSYFNMVKVYTYIKSQANATAKIEAGETKLHNRPAPSVIARSSRGPSMIDRHILKPDIIAPGLNILAAWSDASSPTTLLDDHRIVKYNIISGSSIAVPHVTAVASLLKAIHPTWSPAAIKSALMTTASTRNDRGILIADYDGNDATPFSLGSGHIMPMKAVDPGLIYDASYRDYFIYLCNKGEKDFVNSIDSNFSCPEISIPSYNLNYPSLTLLNIKDNVTVQRIVTNVGNEHSSYSFQAKPPVGISIEALPDTLIFDSIGQKKVFTITVTSSESAKRSYGGKCVFGEYYWTDNNDHIVRSPMVISLKVDRL